MNRVALVVPGLEEGGGVPVVALFLARVMVDSGRYQPEFVSVATAAGDPTSVRLRSPATWLRGVTTRRGEWQGWPFVHVGCVASELEFQRYRPRRVLTELLDGYDLVQVVTGSPCWTLAARDVHCPVGVQVATLVVEERRELLARDRSAVRHWRAWMTRMASRDEEVGMRLADAIFVENQWMFDHLSARLDADRVIFAAPGIDTERFRPAGPPGGAGPILSVGRFADPRKRVSLLFEAYARLCERLDDPPLLLLAGLTGPSDADWERATRLGVRDRIEFREDVRHDALVELYRESSVFAVSSDEEGLGLAIREAMACGVPVVSTDCGGPSMSVEEGQTGYLVPRGDAKALADRMAALLTDADLRARMGTAARERAEDHFSLRAAGRLFLDWYDRALAGDPSSVRPEHRR